jgi:mannose-6-phosphate isomerase-like protein (cupin superfamily)
LLLVGATTLLAAARCRSAKISTPAPINLAKAGPSKYEPRDPFTQVAPGTFGRLEFQSEDVLGVRIDVRQILVAPRQAVTLPYRAAAVYEIRAGAGWAEIGGARQELHAGTLFLAGQEQEVQITNTGELPLGFSVHLIEALK